MRIGFCKVADRHCPDRSPRLNAQQCPATASRGGQTAPNAKKMVNFQGSSGVVARSRRRCFRLTGFPVDLLKRRIALFTIIPILSMAIAVFNTRLALVAYLLILTAHFLPARIDENALPSSGDPSAKSERP